MEADKANVKIAPMITEFFECACFSDEHTVKFSYDPDSAEIYASVFLHQYRNIFQRLWVALRYVFGYHCKYGHWDCFIMRPEDASRLRSLLDRLVEDAARKPA